MVEDLDDSEPHAADVPTKKSKKTASATHPDGKDDDGNPFWEVSSRMLKEKAFLSLINPTTAFQ